MFNNSIIYLFCLLLFAFTNNKLALAQVNNQQNLWLDPVEIIGNNKQDYFSNYSFSTTRISLKNQEIPQSISTVSKELLADQRVIFVNEALKNTSGVEQTSFYSHFAIRGITQNEMGIILNGMRTRQLYFTQPLTTNVERIEVIKGPASATFSSTDPGGSINLVTKKPLNKKFSAISFSTGSYANNYITLDFTGPLNQNKTLLYRINSGYNYQNSFRDLQHQSVYQITPSISFTPNSGTLINAELIYNNYNTILDRGQPIYGSAKTPQARLDALRSSNINLNLAQVDDYLKSSDITFILSLSQKIIPGLEITAKYMTQQWISDIFETRTDNGFIMDTFHKVIPSLVARRSQKQNYHWNTHNLYTYINWGIVHNKISNNLMLGYDLSINDNRFNQLQARGYIKKDNTSAGRFRKGELGKDYKVETIKVNGEERVIPVPNVNYFDLNNPSYNLRDEKKGFFYTPNNTQTYYITQALYLQNIFQYSRLTALIGFRAEVYNYKPNIYKAFSNNYLALLPRIGLTFKINKNINIYATYLTGYQPQNNVSSLLGIPLEADKEYTPLSSDLREFGLKSSWLNEKLLANISAYEVNQRNMLVADADFSKILNRGHERSRGIELEVIGRPMENLSVSLVYSFIHARILNSPEENLKNAITPNMPQNIGNLWVRYDLPPINRTFKGLGIGVGAHYSGEKIAWFERDLQLPAYTLIDFALYYHFFNDRATIQFNLKNITNEKYWIGGMYLTRVFPGMPINWNLSLVWNY